MPRELNLDNRLINDESDMYVIAEVGHNHMGDMKVAREMFRVAKMCGANAIKLQKRDNRSLYTRAAYDQPYENRNSYGPTYGTHREALEFNKEQYQELIACAKELDITFFATAFDFESADFLAELDMPIYKIASGDLINIPLMKYVAQFQKPMIVSTGGGTMEEVQRAYDAVMPINPQLAILQCTSGYPVTFDEMNLRVINTFRDRFPQSIIGLSAHDNGIAMAVAAYVLGARIIEKHFTLNRANKGTDHAFSLEPTGMEKMIRDLRRTRMALGDGVKYAYPSETEPLKKMRKKIVAAREIPTGSILAREDLALKSPGDNGLPPYELDKLIGHRTKTELHPDDPITFDILNGA